MTEIDYPVAPLPAVGGPAHGRLYAWDGTKSDLVIPHMDDIPAVAPPHVRHTRYRRQKFSVQYGALSLEGWAWVWSEAAPEDVRRQAFALLVATALR